MTPLPAVLGGRDLIAWRLDQRSFAATWNSGEGAFRFGGRWNSRGVRTVYCALDPATAILEVAVHKGFRALDTVPHMLTAIEIDPIARIHVVQPEDVPNPNWLRPGMPSAGQQAFGNDLLATQDFIVLPSVVSTHSWNLMFLGGRSSLGYAQRSQEPFALDTRLHPAP